MKCEGRIESILIYTLLILYTFLDFAFLFKNADFFVTVLIFWVEFSSKKKHAELENGFDRMKKKILNILYLISFPFY